MIRNKEMYINLVAISVVSSAHFSFIFSDAIATTYNANVLVLNNK